MIINVEQNLKTIDGTVLKDNDGNGNVIDATVRMALVNAVLSPHKEDDGMAKVKKYELAKKIFNNSSVDINEDEIKLLKDCVGTAYAPIVVGQLFELLKV